MKAKFRNIKTFPRCPYRCDVSWTHLERHIAREVKDVHLDLNPDFQRAHVWNTTQQTAYIEYILQGGTSGRELYFNCVGWMRDWRGPYVIVDGKQRMEAVRAFMRGDIPAFGSYINDYEDEPDMLIARFSWNVASLDSRADVLRWYINFNRGGTVHTEDEIERVKHLLKLEEQASLNAQAAIASGRQE